MDTQLANRIWLPTQPRHYTTREKIPLSRQLLKMGTRWPETCWATYKEQLIRRNKYNTKWHLVGFLFHIELRCHVNHISNLFFLLIYNLFYAAVSNSRAYSIEIFIVVNNELKSMRKEAVKAKFMVPSLNLSGRTDKNHTRVKTVRVSEQIRTENFQDRLTNRKY